jgi:predicted RNA-binding protein with RPS1 domain
MSQSNPSEADQKKPASKNFVTPLKREPVALFGQKVPASALAPERPKAPPAPTPPPPSTPPQSTSAGTPPQSVRADVAAQNTSAGTPPQNVSESQSKPAPLTFTPPSLSPASEKPPRAPRPDVIRKMPILNRRITATDEEVEAELANVMGEMPEDALYAADSSSVAAQAGGGKNKKGKVISIHGDDVFVDIGGRSQGVIPLDTFNGAPKIGDELEVIVKGFDSANGCMLLALPGAAEAHVDWNSVTRGMVVEARVTGTNKGGLSVEVNGIRGFLPISQLELFRVEDTAPYVNQRLRCLVAEVEPQEKNLVLSRRALLEKDRAEAREKLWTELAEGQRRTAIVGNLKDFGAFVDLGGCDALLPIGEIAWGKTEDISKVLAPGQRVEVKVIRLDKERQKVTVSLRECMASPWDEVGDKYPIGTILPGKVTRIMDFGAFVELEPGVEGLLHISELASKRIFRVTDVVKEGQTVEVKVTKYDPETKRLSLSLKAVQKERDDAAKAAAEGEQPVEEVEEPAKPLVRRTDLKGGL